MLKSSIAISVLIPVILLISFSPICAQQSLLSLVNNPDNRILESSFKGAGFYQPDTTDINVAATSVIETEDKSNVVRFNLGYVLPWGLKGRFRISDSFYLGAEVIPFFLDWNFYFGRGYYRFHIQEHWNPYAFGTLGVVQYRPLSLTGYGIGAGLGVQYNIQGLEDTLEISLLPLAVYAELDGRYINHDFYRAYYNLIRVRAGIRYNFRSR